MDMPAPGGELLAEQRDGFGVKAGGDERRFDGHEKLAGSGTGLAREVFGEGNARGGKSIFDICRLDTRG